VPCGVRCSIFRLKNKQSWSRIVDIHTNIPIEKVTNKWAVGVKIYGHNLIKLTTHNAKKREKKKPQIPVVLKISLGNKLKILVLSIFFNK
jgi:hypothetical protein